eukprot:TRINITY_DN2771_c0_g1_i1.p1 TRINITY_DN2771_c0_g1~~TRINITY_DN2771_c0_g1_i1.p1  ORF type:complete len:590 (+),score=147.43 TRINITY_DN2771_c0_g1_i1:78-1772(+)
MPTSALGPRALSSPIPPRPAGSAGEAFGKLQDLLNDCQSAERNMVQQTAALGQRGSVGDDTSTGSNPLHHPERATRGASPPRFANTSPAEHRGAWLERRCAELCAECEEHAALRRDAEELQGTHRAILAADQELQAENLRLRGDCGQLRGELGRLRAVQVRLRSGAVREGGTERLERDIADQLDELARQRGELARERADVAAERERLLRARAEQLGVREHLARRMEEERLASAAREAALERRLAAETAQLQHSRAEAGKHLESAAAAHAEAQGQQRAEALAGLAEMRAACLEELQAQRDALRREQDAEAEARRQQDASAAEETRTALERQRVAQEEERVRLDAEMRLLRQQRGELTRVAAAREEAIERMRAEAGTETRCGQLLAAALAELRRTREREETLVATVAALREELRQREGDRREREILKEELATATGALAAAIGPLEDGLQRARQQQQQQRGAEQLQPHSNLPCKEMLELCRLAADALREVPPAHMRAAVSAAAPAVDGFLPGFAPPLPPSLSPAAPDAAAAAAAGLGPCRATAPTGCTAVRRAAPMSPMRPSNRPPT